ncbi:MAG TPA: glycosyltransferase [bacterium]
MTPAEEWLIRQTVPQRRSALRAAPAAEPLRIMRILARMNIGGPAVHAIVLGEGFRGPRYESLLVTGVAEPHEGDLRLTAIRRGVRVAVVPAMGRAVRPLADLRAWWQILSLMIQERPRIVHTHTSKAGALGRTAAIVYNALWGRGGRRCRVVHTFHGHVLEGYFSPARTNAFIQIERLLARGSDRLIAVSEAVRQDLLRRRIGRPEQILVVPLGLPLEELLAMPQAPEDGEEIRVGLIGRLVPIKHHRMFLEAIKVSERDPVLSRVQFEIVGDGELRGELEAEARRLGVADRVLFTGWEQDTRRLYGRMDVVCLTSRNEGTPVSLIEGMAAGRPVLATDVGGVAELLGPGPGETHGHCLRMAHGMLVRTGDVEGLCEGLRYLATYGGERRRMGSAGRAFVAGRYAAARLVGDLERVYEELCA